MRNGVQTPFGQARSPFQRLKLGSDLITNGGFSADSNWSKGAGWTISGGKANKATGSASAISQTVGTGLSYVRVTFTVSGVTAGGVTPRSAGSGAIAGTTITADGTYTQDIEFGDNNILQFLAGATFDGSIDNVIAQEILS